MIQSASALRAIPSTSYTVNTPQAAIECRTLEALLELSPPNATILLTDLILVTPHTGLYKRHYLAHMTALTPSNHILYATFHAAQTLGLANKASLIEPFKHRDGEAQAQQLLQEMQRCLYEVIQTHSITLSARYRLPDDWVWCLRSTTPHIVLKNAHWCHEK